MIRPILGIDPGTHQMGAAVLQEKKLLAYGVHTLHNGERPRDLIDQARRVVLSYIHEYGPAIVGIEKPLLLPTKRAALVSVITQELHARSRELGLRVIEIAAPDVRQILTGDPNAKKIDIAHTILDRGFEELRAKVPTPPRKAALGYHPRDKYWLHMFDALAVAIALSSGARSTRGK